MGKSELRIRSLSRLDSVAISCIHADTSQIAHRFMGSNYGLDDVQSWCASKSPNGTAGVSQ